MACAGAQAAQRACKPFLSSVRNQRNVSFRVQGEVSQNSSKRILFERRVAFCKWSDCVVSPFQSVNVMNRFRSTEVSNRIGKEGSYAKNVSSCEPSQQNVLSTVTR